MNLIVAADNHWGIGKDGRLLLRIPSDMKFFRQKTIGNVVLMGRKTLDSLPGGKPLPDRLNLVLTRDKSFAREGVIVCHSVAEAVETAESFGKEIYVIGGGSIYEQLLPYCERAIVTRIDAVFDADTFLPDLDESDDWGQVGLGGRQVYQGVEFYTAEYIRLKDAI